ncbi:uncharacterized protein [Panulirus ornatus]|uniref:uncharacterized protein n=1 Tax=Panulirus ornatus TaxID=150431 RepID=UPI003A85999D
MNELISKEATNRIRHPSWPKTFFKNTEQEQLWSNPGHRKFPRVTDGVENYYDCSRSLHRGQRSRSLAIWYKVKRGPEEGGVCQKGIRVNNPSQSAQPVCSL